MSKEVRLQKYIAGCGICSRRKAEELIEQGKVKVNGKVVDQQGVKIIEGKDVVEVSGKIVKQNTAKTYIMLNKPKGYVTTVSDQFDRPTVIDLVKGDLDIRLFPVGRLDYQTQGLLLLTNDGDFANSIIHPSKKIVKTYIAKIKGIPEHDTLNMWRKGVDIGDYTTKEAKVEIIKTYTFGCDVKFSIVEGKNRQVRLMCETLGHEVIELKRIAIGNLTLGNLPTGKWRRLNKAEINTL